MKANELTKCGFCGQGVMHAGSPIFHRVKLETFGVDAKAIQRRHGMELMMGGGTSGAVLAHVMGTDEDIAKPLNEPVQLLVCHSCAIDPKPLLILGEVEDKRKTAPERAGP